MSRFSRWSASASRARAALAVIASLAATALAQQPVAAAPSVVPFQPTLNATNPGAPASRARWNGRLVSIDIHPTNQQVAIVASESGGLFRTTDGGTRWTHIDNFIPFRVHDVKFAPQDPTIIVVTAAANSDRQNPGGIWVGTTDANGTGAITWRRPLGAHFVCGGVTNPGAYAIAFEETPNSRYLYVGTDCGLAYSSNLGADNTWALHSQSQPVLTIIAPSSDSIYDCSGQSVFRLRRSGTMLTQVSQSQPHIRYTCGEVNGASGSGPYLHNLAIAPQEQNVLFTVTSTGVNCPNDFRINYELLESQDSGVTWAPRATTCKSGGRPAYVSTRRTPPPATSDKFTLFFSAGVHTLSGSCTSGVGTAPRCQNPSANVANDHVDHMQVAFTSDNCAKYLLTDGGIQMATDCAGTAFRINPAITGLDALQIADVAGQSHTPSGETSLHIGTMDNGLWSSRDSGATWPRSFEGEGGAFAIAPTTTDPSFGVLTFKNEGFGTNYVAPNGPAGDSCQYTPVSGMCPFRFQPNGTNNLVSPAAMMFPLTFLEAVRFADTRFFLGFLTDSGGVLGANWSEVTGPNGAVFSLPQQIAGTPQVSPILVSAQFPQTTYVGACVSGCGRDLQDVDLLRIEGARQNRAVSTKVNDGSTSDTRLGMVGSYCSGTLFCPRPVFSVAPFDWEHLIAADGPNKKMKVSHDSGATWTVDTALTNLVTGTDPMTGTSRYDFNTPHSGVQAHVITFDAGGDPQRILVGTEAAGAFGSLDGGESWIKIPGSEQITSITSFFFDTTKGDVVVSSYGRGLWKIKNFDSPTLPIIKNEYDGPKWWGTMGFKNTGKASVTNYKVEFDVPAGSHCTNEPGAVPSGATLSPLVGTGASAHTVSSHCVFTWTNAPALAVGATKTFNYSTDSQSFTEAEKAKAQDPSWCTFLITQNVYDGPDWWGTMRFKNTGSTSVSKYKVEFDVPPGVHCTNDAVPSGATLSPLTGTGSSARTVSNHCVFTWLNSAVSAGSSKTFNYSTDSQSFSQAINVVASNTTAVCTTN